MLAIWEGIRIIRTTARKIREDIVIACLAIAN